MRPLTVKQTAFKADEITYLDRKSILLDRVLLNLFELLRYDGRPPVRRRKMTVTVDSLVDLMQQTSNRFEGFAEEPDVARAWLVGDLLEIMNRGKPGRETVVGPRPFHLNAYKLANQRAVTDYGASQQVRAMLYHIDAPILNRLKDFFGRGLDVALDKYDQTTELDLETLAVLGLVDQIDVDHATATVVPPIRPVCNLQGAILADDLRRLLAYERFVPRHVLASYIRDVLGLHLALMMLRLLKILPDWTGRCARYSQCRDCPLDNGRHLKTSDCHFFSEIVIDAGSDPTSETAALAAASATQYFGAVSGYVRAVIILNRIKEFAASQVSLGAAAPVRTVDGLLAVLASPPDNMSGYFQARINDVLVSGKDEQEDPVVTEILQLADLSTFDKYAELICFARMKNERNSVIKMLDSLCQKNRDTGFLRQPAGARSSRRFAIGNHLLETLVQIAVVERDAQGRLKSKNLLIEDFLQWLYDRYGFTVYAPNHREVGPEEQNAWRSNERALRERLRQIGFFTDLSDAYNSQTLRPRYRVTIND